MNVLRLQLLSFILLPLLGRLSRGQRSQPRAAAIGTAISTLYSGIPRAPPRSSRGMSHLGSRATSS